MTSKIRRDSTVSRTGARGTLRAGLTLEPAVGIDRLAVFA
jgi:hypothetical protein